MTKACDFCHSKFSGFWVPIWVPKVRRSSHEFIGSFKLATSKSLPSPTDRSFEQNSQILASVLWEGTLKIFPYRGFFHISCCVLFAYPPPDIRFWSTFLVKHKNLYTSLINFILPLSQNFSPKRKCGKEKKKMWKGDFLCVGSVLEFKGTTIYVVCLLIFES